ncbi:MAG: type II toxin-antitoxin system HicA family toxin [Candidatus Obscuribacterales bacterium]|nr:type II toxin-antitoxin system HicA family toxin [Candidatus Obscuribacterales bacterium]
MKLVPLRPLSFREVKRKLEAAGFAQVSQKGSHVKFSRESENGVRTAIVPNHSEIAIGTLRSILRQAGLTPEEFEKL